MKLGEREKDGATLQINICQAIPPKLRVETREISDVHVPAKQRKTGLGSALMHQVCDEADSGNITLLLTCSNELRRWYARFGFIVLQDNIGLLARMPGSTPRTLTPINKAISDFH